MDVNLVRIKKDGTHKSFTLTSEITVIGRRRNCDLRVPLMTVSKRHCQIILEDGPLKIRDLNSRNGTLLNGESLDEAMVKAGDYIKVGPLSFVFQIDGIPKKIEDPATKTKKSRSPGTSADNLSVEDSEESAEDDPDILISGD